MLGTCDPLLLLPLVEVFALPAKLMLEGAIVAGASISVQMK
jgi:hypothetical protein